MTASGDVVQSIGCDYITCLAKDAAGWHPLKMHGFELLRMEEAAGNKMAGFGMSGFTGLKCGSVQVAQRDKEFLVRLSSYRAANSWTTVARCSDNVSRFDVQATVFVVPDPARRIDREKRLARLEAKKGGDKKVVRWVADNRGGYTLYLGVRSSNVFGRIYDKYAQTQLDHYRGCVRYEVQFQGHLARRVCFGLRDNASQISHMASHVMQFFNGRGLRLEIQSNDEARYSCSRERSDAEKCLVWLRTAVSPSVKRLIDAGKGEEVYRALGLIVD